MGTPVLIPTDVQVAGNIVASGIITSSTAFVTDALVQAGAAIQATKLIHQHNASIQLFGPTTTITALTQLAYIVGGTTSSLVEFSAAIVTKATDVSRTVNVDLQRSTGGGAFVTTLAATIQFTSSSGNLTVLTATPTATLAINDLLQIVVTVAGASGSQALGLICSITTRESAT